MRELVPIRPKMSVHCADLRFSMAPVEAVPGLIQSMLRQVHNLYHDHGARNFLFIGIAATQYYPIGKQSLDLTSELWVICVVSTTNQ